MDCLNIGGRKFSTLPSFFEGESKATRDPLVSGLSILGEIRYWSTSVVHRTGHWPGILIRSYMAREGRLFIDTWGWLTLRDRREAAHEETVRFYRDFRRGGGFVYTTDYVLDEAITLLFRRLSFSLADASLEKIERAAEAGYLQVERIVPERFEKGLRLRRKYQDKPKISFTDLTSIVVMRGTGNRGGAYRGCAL